MPLLYRVSASAERHYFLAWSRARSYIHCKNGHSRTPTFSAAHLIREAGMTPDEAVRHIAAKRPEIHLEESQAGFLRSLSAH